MYYAYRKDNKWHGPVAMRSRFDGVGGWHTLTDEQRAEHQWYPCVTLNEQYDRKTQRRSEQPISYRLTDGIVTAEYVITDKALSEQRAERHREIDKIRDEQFAKGFTYDFGETYGLQTLQMRNDRDRTNWLALDSAATKLIAAGLEDTMLSLRPESNIEMEIPATQVSSILSALSSHGSAIMKRSWELKDAVDAADDPYSVDIESGWPV